MRDHADRDRAEASPSASTPSHPANGDLGEGIRRWRQSAEWAGRDHRPGFYSITGEFIAMLEQPESDQQ